jgi:S-adenosylmethionine:tRNA ribosyltransferase-isomerase
MNVEEFDYPLPPSSIAQYPTPERGASRLMFLQSRLETIEHRTFSDLPGYLCPGDLLVLNNTRVLPARLIGTKETGGRCEVLLIPAWNGKGETWEALMKDSGKIKPGTRLRFGEDFGGVVEDIRGGKARIRLQGPGEPGALLQRYGHVPLPPYIRRKDEPLDRERYQTVYAERDGSIASPTAGLHFSSSMLEALRHQGVKTAFITLHVGIGTFSPVRVEELKAHTMEAEWIEISEEVATLIGETKKEGGKVIAVGTTTTRALESFSDKGGEVRPGSGLSSLFIYPPYRFRCIDGLITNFHLPRSTLVMLVSAFAGKDFLMKAYREAIREGYRFYSYGDAMLIL